jgi:hypothetical protein
MQNLARNKIIWASILGWFFLMAFNFAAAKERVVDIDKGSVELELVNLPAEDITYTIARVGRCSCQIKEEGAHLKISHGRTCPASNRVKIYIPSKLAGDLTINLGVGQVSLKKAKAWDHFNQILAETKQGTIIAENQEKLISAAGKQGKILLRPGKKEAEKKVNLSVLVQDGMISF